MDELEEIIKSYVNAYNNYDVPGMMKDFDDNIVFENFSNGNMSLRTEGLDEFREQAESAKQYFSERKQTIESWVFGDTIVTITIDYQATLAIDLPNGMKTGDSLQLQGTTDFEIVDGKIQKITDRS